MANGVIDSYNGSGLTLGAYIDGILKQNNEAGGVASAPHIIIDDGSRQAAPLSPGARDFIFKNAQLTHRQFIDL
jgi:hypothetical protein